MIDLGIPSDDNAAAAINDNGQITGRIGNPWIAMRWENGTVTELGLMAGGTFTYGTAINNHGDVAGWGTAPMSAENPELAIHAFFWSNGHMTDLGVLPGKGRSIARGVNDARQVVGISDLGPAGTYRGFVWQDGAMRALEELIPAVPKIRIMDAYAINDQGQIAGGGVVVGTTDRVALRLTPIPPTTGDTNCDSLVNVSDLLAVIQTWGVEMVPEPFNGSPDVNGDGMVNMDDLVGVITHWTTTATP
jgi:probable HAF family extracellular repeat protein